MGIWSDKLFGGVPDIAKWLVRLFATVRAVYRLPVQLMNNIGFCVPKKVISHISDHSLADGVRFVHSYATAVKHYMGDSGHSRLKRSLCIASLDQLRTDDGKKLLRFS